VELMLVLLSWNRVLPFDVCAVLYVAWRAEHHDHIILFFLP
jgi:hypothetical protein